MAVQQIGVVVGRDILWEDCVVQGYSLEANRGNFFYLEANILSSVETEAISSRKLLSGMKSGHFLFGALVG
jgi:hypothetical protein